MKKLRAYDFDGTLMNSPEPNPGKDVWKEKTGEVYPHKGWWGRKESLNTDVFDIKPFQNILDLLRKDMSEEDTHVIVLTARQEKLRPELENILKLNNIQVDEVVMKKGAASKGDILLKYIKLNPELEEVTMYDDFADGMEDKILELTSISSRIPENVVYNIVYIKDGKIDSLLESSNKTMKIINEEILKYK